VTATSGPVPAPASAGACSLVPAALPINRGGQQESISIGGEIHSDLRGSSFGHLAFGIWQNKAIFFYSCRACASPRSSRSGARSATNSRFRSAACITASSIARATSRCGGKQLGSTHPNCPRALGGDPAEARHPRQRFASVAALGRRDVESERCKEGPSCTGRRGPVGRVMTSLRQIEANRLNALKSTGPKTEDGKQRSRYTGWTPGLLDGFSRAWIAATARWLALPKISYPSHWGFAALPLMQVLALCRRRT